MNEYILALWIMAAMVFLIPTIVLFVPMENTGWWVDGKYVGPAQKQPG